MVVIHVAHIDTNIIGGVQKAVPQIVAAQVKYASVALINIEGSNLDGIQMLPYKGKFDKLDFPTPFNEPDLVVFHELYRFQFIKMYKSLKKAKIPYIIIPHGSFSKQAQKRKAVKKFMANILFFNAFVNSAEAIQYLSENEEQMSDFKKKSFVCPNGTTVPENVEKDFSHNRVKFIYIGRLEIKTKGLDLLMEAAYNIRDFLRNNRATIEIYGPEYNDERKKLKKIIEKRKMSDIISVGKEKIGKEKTEVLLSADYFIQASRTEGLPMGPLEALSYGLPCIVTEGTGLGELIEENKIGFCCETSADGISKAIKAAIEKRNNIEEMSAKAVFFIKNNFDWDVIAKKAINIYEKI